MNNIIIHVIISVTVGCQTLEKYVFIIHFCAKKNTHTHFQIMKKKFFPILLLLNKPRRNVTAVLPPVQSTLFRRVKRLSLGDNCMTLQI